MTLQNYVKRKMASADKAVEASGYPLMLENCKKHKKMRRLEIYGNSFQDGTPSPENPIEVQSFGELVTDDTDINYGKYKIPVVQRGINILPDGNVVLPECGSLKVNGITWTRRSDGSYLVNGTATNNTALYMISTSASFSSYNKPLRLKAGIYYTTNTRSGVLRAYNITDNKYETWYGSSITFTKDVELSSIYLVVVAGETLSNEVFYPFISMQKVASSDYEPYVEPIVTNVFLDEPLRKLGNYADYIDFKNNKVVRKCVKKYLKDYNNWGVSSEYDTHYVFTAKDNTIIPSYDNQTGKWNHGIGKSNMFPMYAASDYSKSEYALSILMHPWALNIRLCLPIDYVTEYTVTALKAWLAENNPYMIRVLAAPIEEPITLDLPKLTAKTTIIEVDTSLAPSKIYGKYIKR